MTPAQVAVALRAALCGACCALWSVRGVHGSVVALDNDPFETVDGIRLYWTRVEPVFGAHDTPDGEKPPFVHLDAKFSRSGPGKAGFVEVLAFHSDYLQYIGDMQLSASASSDECQDGRCRWICCVSKLKDEQRCHGAEIGQVIKTADYTGPMALSDSVFVPANATSVPYNPSKWPVTQSGMYTILAVSCDPELGIESLTGEAIFQNPYGYLPAHLYGSMPFWHWMLVAYFSIGAVWFALALRNWRELLHLQMCITGILFVGMVEACSWNVLYETYNSSGQIALAASVFASVMTTSKRTVSRMLVLVVSMGYGVVKPTLGVRANRVLILGAIYFVCATMLEIVEWVAHTEPEAITIYVRLLFVMPVAILDSTFSVWIFSELSATTLQLEARSQQSKLRLYRRFTRIMATCVLLSVAFSSYEVYITSPSGTPDLPWENFWMLEAFWSALYFVVLVSIMWLWAPSKNAIRYAYSEEIAMDDEDYGFGDEDDDEQADVGTGGATSLQLKQLSSGGPLFQLDDEEEQAADCEDKRM